MCVLTAELFFNNIHKFRNKQSLIRGKSKRKKLCMNIFVYLNRYQYIWKPLYIFETVIKNELLCLRDQEVEWSSYFLYSMFPECKYNSFTSCKYITRAGNMCKVKVDEDDGESCGVCIIHKKKENLIIEMVRQCLPIFNDGQDIVLGYLLPIGSPEPFDMYVP
jgi:hypothetical protein